MLGLSLILPCAGQTGAPRVPAEFSLETAADYKKYEALAEKCMIWLLQNPIDEYPEQREELEAFSMLWLSGSPEVHLDIQSKVLPCLQQHPELFPVFICGMGLYQMQHPREMDEVVLHAEGLRAVGRMTKQSKSLKRERCLKPLKRACRKSTLKLYASERLDQA